MSNKIDVLVLKMFECDHFEHFFDFRCRMAAEGL